MPLRGRDGDEEGRGCGGAKWSRFPLGVPSASRQGGEDADVVPARAGGNVKPALQKKERKETKKQSDPRGFGLQQEIPPVFLLTQALGVGTESERMQYWDPCYFWGPVGARPLLSRQTAAALVIEGNKQVDARFNPDLGIVGENPVVAEGDTEPEQS